MLTRGFTADDKVFDTAHTEFGDSFTAQVQTLAIIWVIDTKVLKNPVIIISPSIDERTVFMIESSLLTILGTVSGTVLALILSWELISSDYFHNSLENPEIVVPVLDIAAFVIVALLVSLLMAWIRHGGLTVCQLQRRFVTNRCRYVGVAG